MSERKPTPAGDRRATPKLPWHRPTLPERLEKYLDHGFAVIPQEKVADGKVPRVPYARYVESPPDREIVEAWYLRHGEDPNTVWAFVSGRPYFALDFDERRGGIPTLERLGLKPTMRTPRDGAHVYVEPPNFDVRTAQSVDGYPGMEVLAAPHPVTFLGRTEHGEYRRTKHLPYKFADLPEELQEAIRSIPPKYDAEPFVIPEGFKDWTPVGRLIDLAVAKVDEEGRNFRGYILACWLRAEGYDEFETQTIVLEQYLPLVTDLKDHPYTTGEAVESVASAFNGPPMAPMGLRNNDEFERRVEDGLFNKRIKTEVDLRWASERAIIQSGLSRHITAGTWLFDEPVGDPIWGNGTKILWARLQALLIASADGLGKTSVAQQLCLHLLGVRPPSFLGSEVKPLPEDQIIVYLAMDRPEQARQSMLRMVSPEDKERLDRRCHLWQGPMPISVAQPGAMADWLQTEFGEHIGAVVVDTYKDFGLALSDDAVGIAINSAMQEVIARGIQWLGLTHPTKDGRSLRTIEDVYGSRHLFSGCGSVLGLRGAVSGTTNVELAQLKTPIESIFPLQLIHDHASGTTMRRPGAGAILDLLVEGGEDGVGEDKVCLILFGHDGGEEGSKHKDRKATRRQLERLEEAYPDSVSHKPGQSGGKVGGGSAARWFAKPPVALNVEFGVSGEVSWG